MESSAITNPGNKVYGSFYRFLVKPSGHDGRILVFVFLAIYFLSVYLSSFFMDYTKFWHMLGVPSARPHFEDLYFISKVLNCYRLGYDIYKSSPCCDSSYSYPKLWLYLSPIWVKPEYNSYLAIALISLYYFIAFIIIQRISTNEGIYYGLLLCSPPLMLAVERGNPDLIIFILCGLAIWTIRKKYSPYLAACLLMFSGFLKLYPFATIGSFLRSEKKSVWMLAGLLVVSLFYMVFTYESIKLSVSNMQNIFFGSVAFCHGYLVMFKLLNTYSVFNHIFQYVPYQAIALFAVVALCVSIYLYAKNHNSLVNTDHLFAFRTGALLYIGSFMCGQNFDYKFIMFIFTIPQLLLWLRDNKQITTLTLLALGSILVSCWSILLFGKIFYFFIYTSLKEMLNWYVFAYFMYMLILTLPEWLKGYLLIKPLKAI